MYTVIGSLLDRLQGLLSRAFLLGGFIPVFIFLLIDAALAYALLPGVRDYAGYWFRVASDHVAISCLVIVLITFFGGLAVWSLNAWFRQFLEGRYLPGMLRSQLQKSQYNQFMQMNDKLDAMKRDLFDYRGEVDDRSLQKGLKAARIEGTNSGNANPVSAEVFRQAGQLRSRRRNWQNISFTAIREYYTALEAELRTNSADDVKDLDKLQTEFTQLVDYGAERLEGRYARLVSDKRMRFPDEISDFGPTLMANLSEVHREYGIRHYKLDIEFFWIRLLKVIQSDADLYPILEGTKNQLDYSVTMTVLIGIASVLWAVLSYLCCVSVIPFLTVLVAGWLLTSIFYSITVQNYRSFVETVRSALDLHRFELLKALHIGLPTNSVEEKMIWEKVYLWRDDDPVEFVHEETKPTQPA
jgi:hypothetical protein